MEKTDILIANQHKFWLGVKKLSPDECWTWMKYKDNRGYGEFQIRYEGKKMNFAAHRVSYELTNGKIPNGLLVCHKCDNPSCVNPNHFFIGTHKDNSDDKVKKNRQAKAETSGKSKLTWDIVRYIRKSFNDKDITVLFLSKKHNIHEKTITNILNGKNWKDENYIPIKLELFKFENGHTRSRNISKKTVIEIKNLINEGLMPKEISEKTGVKSQKIRDIKRGVAYFNIKV